MNKRISIFSATSSDSLSVRAKDPDIVAAFACVGSLQSKTSLDLSAVEIVAVFVRVLRMSNFPDLLVSQVCRSTRDRRRRAPHVQGRFYDQVVTLSKLATKLRPWRLDVWWLRRFERAWTSEASPVTRESRVEQDVIDRPEGAGGVHRNLPGLGYPGSLASSEGVAAMAPSV